MHADAPPDLATIYRTYTALMVRHPQDLQVEQIVDPNVVQLRIRGHRADQGLLIGSNGQNVKAMQTILAQIAARRDQKVRIRILEPHIGEVGPNAPFEPNPHWTAKEDELTAEYVSNLLGEITGFAQSVEVHSDSASDSTSIRWAGKSDSSELEDALHTLFRAIGKTQGRLLSFHAMSTPQSPVRA
jgi:predicted RNA-binding protein YlqC (UPF0109 family)